MESKIIKEKEVENSKETQNSKEDGKLEETKSKKGLIIAIIAIIIIALVSFYVLKIYNTPPPVVQEPVQEEIIVEEEIIVVDTIVETPVIEEPIVVEPIKNFAVIGGSFKEESNANKFNEKLENNGFDSKISLTYNNYYCVSYSFFEKKEDAINYLREKRSEGVKVWLLFVE